MIPVYRNVLTGRCAWALVVNEASVLALIGWGATIHRDDLGTLRAAQIGMVYGAPGTVWLKDGDGRFTNLGVSAWNAVPPLWVPYVRPPSLALGWSWLAIHPVTGKWAWCPVRLSLQVYPDEDSAPLPGVTLNPSEP